MAKQRQTIVVAQCRNPKFNPAELESDNNSQYSYLVEKTVNTLSVAIGEYISPVKVKDLIAAGTEVTVQKLK